MAAFKLPSLSIKKRRRQFSLPEFRWNTICIKEEIGSGTFGSVYLAKCTDEEHCVVIKKLKGEAADAKRPFEKEAAILHSVKGHRNISCFFKVLPGVPRNHDGAFVSASTSVPLALRKKCPR